MKPTEQPPDHPAPHEVRYTVDDVDQVSTERELTPVQIMERASIDPANHYLIELKGQGKQESYKEHPNEPIKLHNNQTFITASLGPTPVS